MSELIGVYGAGGCGRGILPLLREDPVHADNDLVFIDDGKGGQTVNGHRALTYDQFLEEGGRKACLAIADGRIRAKLDEKLIADGVELIGATGWNVQMMDDVEIAPGALLSPNVTITSNVRIGRAFHGNLYSYVEHDCVIGDYVTFGPRVNCNGAVHIEKFAYIGAGALLRQGDFTKPVRVGEGAIIGMGAVVVKDVPPGAIVIGNPARVMEKK